VLLLDPPPAGTRGAVVPLETLRITGCCACDNPALPLLDSALRLANAAALLLF
jgi:hypothetical protein